MKRMKKLLTLFLVTILILTGCSSSKGDLSIRWNKDLPEIIGDKNRSYMKVTETIVKKTKEGEYLLILDVEYTNQLEQSKNLYNDKDCQVKTYQNGVELKTPNKEKVKDLYDCTLQLKDISHGKTIETQMVWVLNDTTSQVKFDFGINQLSESYVSRQLILEGGTKKEKKQTKQENTKDKYIASFQNKNQVFGNKQSNGKIVGQPRIKKVGKNYILVITINYTNKTSTGNCLIGDSQCQIKATQKQQRIDYPANVKEKGIYDTSNSYVNVKDGKIETQIAFQLMTLDDVKLYFGSDESGYENIVTITHS